MTTSITYELGTYSSKIYLLHAEDFSPHASPEEFVVTVYYREDPPGENIEIARVDTAHGVTHFDRLYRRDEPKDPVDWGFWDAIDHLDRNWKTYAESFERK